MSGTEAARVRRACPAADRLTIADFGIAAFLPHAEDAQLPLEGCDELRRWYGTMREIEAWREPWPAPAKAVA